MPLLLIALCLASCSSKQHDGKVMYSFSHYSDMSAAADAGRTPDASSQARPESGGDCQKVTDGGLKWRP